MNSEFPAEPQMTAVDVIDLLDLFDSHQILVTVDGGWGVDALLGRQTRLHADLDLALPHADVSRLRSLLEGRGYCDVPRDDTRDCNFVLGDSSGHLVDIHSYTFDQNGKITFGVPYPFDSLNGTGHILGRPVRCITPQWMVAFHTGYPLDQNDYYDVKALCQHFGFPIPTEYADFVRADLP